MDPGGGGGDLDDIDYHDMVTITSSLTQAASTTSSLTSSNSFISRLLLKFTWNWTSSTLALIVMRPETVAFLSAIIIVFALTHTFDFWGGLLSHQRRQQQPSSWWSWILFRSPESTSGMSAVAPAAMFSTGLDDKYEVKGDRVGIFAIRGRRGKMEDAYDYVNETQGLGIEIFGVFDGHGSEKASLFTQRHLFKSIVARIAAVMNGTTAKGKSSSSNGVISLIDGSKDSDSEKTCPASRNPTEEGNPTVEKENDATCLNTPKFPLVNGAGECPVTPKSTSSLNSTCAISTTTNQDHQLTKSLSQTSFASFLESNRRLASEVKSILREEILKLDQQLLTLGRKDIEFGGTTAVFAVRLHSLNRLLVANVGDSRGVLCNSRGMTVPLSVDHKPQSPTEHKRIKKEGGFIKWNGVWRVGGILATSRALGDAFLKDKKFITAEPDILSFDLGEHQPQFIILATDGLWDTLSNEEAVKMVREHIAILRKKGKTDNLAFESAKMLTLESYKRLSLDNITVIVVLFDPKDFHSTSTSFGIYSQQKGKTEN